MRDQSLLALRPLLLLPDATTEIEQFQNKTLRPILKFQHELLLKIWFQYVVFRKNTFERLSIEHKQAYVEQAVRQDLKFKNRLLGIVIGHFTEAEYTFFAKNETELTRRMTDLLVQRLQSIDFQDYKQWKKLSS